MTSIELLKKKLSIKSFTLLDGGYDE
jgi:hypothetical protein